MRSLLSISLALLTLTLSSCGQNGPADQVGSLSELSVVEVSRPNLDEGFAPVPQIGIDRGVFQGLPGLDITERNADRSQYLRCQNEPSGPYYRVQTNPGRTGPLNSVQGQLRLPGIQATPTAFPYLYLGGQPKDGVAADAGVYVNYDGSWIPFIAVSGGGGTVNLPREKDASGRVFVYRLSGTQDIKMHLSVQKDGELQLEITGEWEKFELVGTKLNKVGPVGLSTRRAIHPKAQGWRTDGDDQVLKVMTTVAFPGKGDFKYLSGDYQFLGSGWRDLSIGLLGAEPKRRPLTRELVYSTCAAPFDVVNPSLSLLLPQVKAEIRLRRAAQLQAPGESPWHIKGKVLRPVWGEFPIRNTGAVGSQVLYSLWPLKKELLPLLKWQSLEAGPDRKIGFPLLCDVQPGQSLRQVNLLYSQGETYISAAAPSAMPDAKPGDLLFRRWSIPVQLDCEL